MQFIILVFPKILKPLAITKKELGMKINNIDHLVLTVADIDKTIEFDTNILSFIVITCGDNRKALTFGN